MDRYRADLTFLRPFFTFRADYNPANADCRLFRCGAARVRSGAAHTLLVKRRGTCSNLAPNTPLRGGGCFEPGADTFQRTTIANASLGSYDGCLGPGDLIYALPRTNRANDTHFMLVIDPDTVTVRQTVRIDAVSGIYGWNVLHHADAGAIIGIPSLGGPVRHFPAQFPPF